MYLSYKKILGNCAWVALLLTSSFSAWAASQTLTPEVNPFLGTKPCPTGTSGFGMDTGDVFPGAATPHGMVQFSPDTTSNQAGGYWYPDTTIKAFSLTHFSGRGLPYEGDFGFMPVAKAIGAAPDFKFSDYAAAFSHGHETASPGYYKVALDNGNTVELTATPRTGMLQVTFPADAQMGTVLLNMGNNVRGVKKGRINVVDGKELTGFATSTTSGNELYTVYISVVFDQPIKASGTWQDAKLTAHTSATGTQAGAFVSFDTASNKVIHAIAGISYVSVENARRNRIAENSGANFAKAKQAANDAWNTTLNCIQIRDNQASTDNLTVFYTELYHTMIHPNLFDDVNGQYLGFDQKVHTVAQGHHHYTHIPGWDEYRSHSPLVAFLMPTLYSDVAQSLVDDTAQTKNGGVPRWVEQNSDSRGMTGDGGSIILANAHAFGATNFDVKSALADMDENASGANKLRGHEEYLELGWVKDSASVTLEFAIADMAVAQMAKSLGETALYQKYAARAQNWRHIFNQETRTITSRNASGDWDATTQGWTEGSQGQYTWMVPFNLRGLFDAMGGHDKVVPRLDAYFGWNAGTQTYTALNSNFNAQTHFAGNEPDESQPWCFLYAGAPWKTQKVVRDLQTKLFFDDPAGLPGNDDGGAISSWYVFSALGLYPLVSGVGGFVVGSPLFASATVTTDSGHVLQINGLHAAPANPYVQSLQIDGKTSTSLWLPVSTILHHHETTLSFILGPTPNTSWGAAATDAPPSFDAPEKTHPGHR